MSLTREELSEGVTVFRSPNRSSFGVTSTVVSSGEEAFVFDTLWYPEDTRELLRGIKSMGLDPVGLINTHWHLDHTAGNQLFFQTKRIISHSLCIDLMHTDLPAQVENFNKNLEKEDKLRPVYPNETVKDDSVLTIGNREIRFLHTPGHTPDSVLGYLEDERIVIAGDTVMELPFIWYGDSQILIDSLKRLRTVASGKKMVQGHGSLCGSEKLDSDISYIERTKRLTVDCFSSGKTLNEASAEIPLDRCLPKNRIERMPEAYKSVHLHNLEKLYKEIADSTG